MPPQPEAPKKKKKHKRSKNGKADDIVLMGDTKKQKVDDDNVILVKSKTDKIDAVPIVTGNKEDNDNGMLINIGIGPAKDDK